MKKIFAVNLLLVLLCFCGISKSQAIDYEWEDIAESYKNLFQENDKYTVSIDENKLNISLTNSKYGPYDISFNYDDNSKKITYSPTRDISNVDNEYIFYYYFNDTFFYLSWLQALVDQYKIDITQFDLSDKDYGFDEERGEKIILDYNDKKLVIDSIKSFSIDLSKFEDAVADGKGKLDEANTEKYILNNILELYNPFSETFGITDIDKVFTEDVVLDNETIQEAASINDIVKIENTASNKSHITLIVGVILIIIGIATFKISLRKHNK